jgi:hypothetical protein
MVTASDIFTPPNLGDIKTKNIGGRLKILTNLFFSVFVVPNNNKFAP